LQASQVIVSYQGLELINVKPDIALRIELYGVGIAADGPFREAAAYMPERRSQGAASLVLRPITPVQSNQPVTRLRSITVQNRISQEGLGLERGRLGQLLAIVLDFQRTQHVEL